MDNLFFNCQSDEDLEMKKGIGGGWARWKNVQISITPKSQ